MENINQKVILLIHQSSSLYGSDKTLLSLAIAIQKDSNFKPIVVVPTTGPLVERLSAQNITVIILPVAKVSRALLSFKKIWKFPFIVLNEILIFKKTFKSHNIAVVHSNTLAVLMGALVYRHLNAKHIWHVHEIIEKPIILRKIYAYILPKFSDLIITPSKAVKKFWENNQPKNASKFMTVLNGVEVPKPIRGEVVINIRQKLFKVPEDSIVIGLVGRINRHKGHTVLLQAFEHLLPKYDNVYLMMIGSPPPGQEYLEDNLKEIIQNSKASSKCKMIGFYENISEIWAAIDIAVVPTIIPEPFGLVALEAMLAKKPVVASNNGGLTEIIVHDKSGFLFQPSNAFELKEKLELLIQNKDLRKSMGDYGFQRAVNNFSEEKYTKAILNLYNQLID